MAFLFCRPGLQSFLDHAKNFSDLTVGSDGFHQLPVAVHPSLRQIWSQGLSALDAYPVLVHALETRRVAHAVVSKVWWILFDYFVQYMDAEAKDLPTPWIHPVLLIGETQVRAFAQNQNMPNTEGSADLQTLKVSAGQQDHFGGIRSGVAWRSAPWWWCAHLPRHGCAWRCDGAACSGGQAHKAAAAGHRHQTDSSAPRGWLQLLHRLSYVVPAGEA